MTTLNLQVGASTDDASQRSGDRVMDLTNIKLYYGNFGVSYHIGIRFTGVSGLSGSTIDTATLTWRASDTDSGSFIGDWYAHDAEAPGTFTSTADNIADVAQRPRTTATCEGDSTDFGNWTSNGDPTFTGDGTNTIADIIQELADSYDPSTIALLHIYASGTGERVARSWNHDSALAPKLDIDYTAAGGETRSLAGSQPAATGTLARIEQGLRALTGSQPAATGVLTRIEQAVRALAGNQPAASGTLTRVHGRPRSVAGNQPAATGTLTRIEQALRALAGDQPTATGALSRVEQALRALAGDQPAATGTLTRIEKAVRALSGNQPSATGTLTHDAAPTRSLAGDQPSASGALTRIEKALRALTGDQPAATGILTRVEQALRALTGSQPSATGTLTRQEQAVRALTGDQPSATGTLTYVFTAGPGVTIPQKGGGIPVKVGVRLPDLPPARTLEPVPLAAIATFWSIAVIDWVLAVEGELVGQVWVRAELSMRRSRDTRPAVAAASLEGSGIIEWAIPRLQREIEEALDREREAEEEVLLGL